MNLLVDLETAEREFNEAKARLDGLEVHLCNISNEIGLLMHLERTLQENISVLKSRRIITVAVEYKKAKDDLNKIYNKLAMLRINRNSLESSIEQARVFLVERREKYLLALENKASKVIEVNFGRKDDRQGGDTA